jgi:hypothetical protein
LAGGDFDGDGSVDLAEALPPNAVYVIRNGGDGRFVSGTLYRVGGRPSAIRATSSTPTPSWTW